MGAILAIFSKQMQIMHPVEKTFNGITRYQLLAFVVLFGCKLPLFYHMLSHLILSPKMNFYCGGEVVKHGSKFNYTGALNKCPCKDKIHWDTNVFTKTTQIKYDLICARDYWIKSSKTVVYAGQLIGVYIFGAISDKFGRVPSVTLSHIVTGVSGLLVPSMPDIWTFCVMRCFEGVGTGGVVITSYVLMIEYCGPRNRPYISALFHIPINIGHASLAGVSYFIRDCDVLLYAISIPVLVFAVLIPLLVHESAKWLVDSGKIAKAAKVMMKICEFNKKPCPDMRARIEFFLKNRPKSVLKTSILECFKHKQMILNFVAMAFLYFTCGLSYYGVSQYISEMGGNTHLNILFSGIVLVPGTLITTYLIHKVGRKTLTIIYLVGSAITFFIVIFTPASMNVFRVTTACISNCFFFALFIVVFLYGAEIFPTSLRNSMCGILSVISRIGQTISPELLGLKIDYIELIFPVVALITACFMYWPPETRGAILPATIEESLNMSKKKEKRASKSTQT